VNKNDLAKRKALLGVGPHRLKTWSGDNCLPGWERAGNDRAAGMKGGREKKPHHRANQTSINSIKSNYHSKVYDRHCYFSVMLMCRQRRLVAFVDL